MFKERVYADMHIKCLAPQKENKSNDTEDALRISQWLEDGVFQALEQKYLKTLIFCIYSLSMDTKPQELLESYTYNIEHTGNGTSQLSTSFTGSNVLDATPQKVKAQAIQMIRSLVSLTNNFDPLPPNRLVTMKMFFNDQCPKGWYPKCFQPSPPEYVNGFSIPSLKLDVGELLTPHHKVTMELEAIEDTFGTVSDIGSQITLSQQSPVSGSQFKDDTPPSPIDLTQEDPEVKSPNGNNVDGCVSQTDGSQSQVESNKDVSSQTQTSQTQVPIPTYEEFLSFVLLKQEINETMLRERFLALPPSKLQRWLHEFCDQGLLVEVSDGYAVCVHHAALFNRAVHETHGKMRRHITTQALSSALQVSLLVGKALLLRMEQLKLVEKSDKGSYLGFKVIFTDATRGLIRKAIQTATKAAKNEVHNQDDDLSSVFDFAPDNFVTPRASSKRKLVTTSSTKTSASSFVSTCADVPIVQVRKALKKRRLALKTIK